MDPGSGHTAYQSSYPQFFSGQNISGQGENGMCTGTKLLFLSCRDGSVPHRSLSGGCRIIQITVDISHILGNLITVIFDYQILRKPLKILSL